MSDTNYTYKMFGPKGDSYKYGNCEVCGEFCSTIYHQVEGKEYEPGSITHFNCHSMFGHEDCLISIRK